MTKAVLTGIPQELADRTRTWQPWPLSRVVVIEVGEGVISISGDTLSVMECLRDLADLERKLRTQTEGP